MHNIHNAVRHLHLDLDWISVYFYFQPDRFDRAGFINHDHRAFPDYVLKKERKKKKKKKGRK